MIKKSFIVSLSLILAGCATSMKNGTFAKLRPDLTEDETEIWEISSKGNPYTSAERVMENAIQRAAFTSDAEGFDCFFVSNSDSDIKTYNYTEYKKETLNTQSYKYIETNRDSVYSYRNTQREVYVPETRSYSEAFANLYVKFMKEDECQQMKKTKWRQSVYFNKDILPAIK